MYLDWKRHKAGVYAIDIETDGLISTVIHVMCWKNIGTGEVGECYSVSDIQKFFNDTRGAYYVGHNILKFDAPVLRDLAGVEIGVANCIDTLVLSTLYRPSLSGGHSLGQWGKRLGNDKLDFDKWDELTDEMVEYCHQDVAITVTLFKKLVATLIHIEFSEKSIWLQHQMTDIAFQQEKSGFYFDGERAIVLYQEIRQREKELQDEIRRAFPATRKLVRSRQVHTKDGRNTAIYERDCTRFEIVLSDDGRRYEAFERVEFNLGSPKQRTQKILDLGWVPREFTEKTKSGGGGNPKPFSGGEISPSLEEFLEENPVPEILLIAKWMTFNGRANMINTWLENWNEETKCIHGRLFVADTLRFRHQSPNTANIPAVRSRKDSTVLYGEDGYYTYEARDLWCARPERVLVGTDAAGLELRILAHFLNRDEFTKQVVEGDPHQYNADTVGITRPEAKTLIYAIMYGAGDVKIGRTLGRPVFENKKGFLVSPEGGKVKKMFLDKLGIGRLMEDCKNEQQKGRIQLCDGSQVVCPSPHAALNYKLQGSGARVMGLSNVLLERRIKYLELDAIKVGDIHDEWQYDVHPDDAEAFAIESVQAIREAGKRLGLNVPLDGEAKEGLTWAQTH